jgi:hypothetical protein
MTLSIGFLHNGFPTFLFFIFIAHTTFSNLAVLIIGAGIIHSIDLVDQCSSYLDYVYFIIYD